MVSEQGEPAALTFTRFHAQSQQNRLWKVDHHPHAMPAGIEPGRVEGQPSLRDLGGVLEQRHRTAVAGITVPAKHWANHRRTQAASPAGQGQGMLFKGSSLDRDGLPAAKNRCEGQSAATGAQPHGSRN